MLLHAERICFAYGQRDVLRNAELSVREGEIHALIGPTGCGKTTLLHIIAGFLSPSSGTVWFEGKPVLSPSRERWMIFQSFDQLFPWMTLEKNLRYAQKRALPEKSRVSCARDAKEALGLMELSSCASLYPRQLSGGMRQRAALARALTLRPRLLLLDEPFSSLDASSRREAQHALQVYHENEKTAMLMVTHDLDEAAALADRATVWGEKGPSATLDLTGDALLQALKAYYGATSPGKP